MSLGLSSVILSLRRGKFFLFCGVQCLGGLGAAILQLELGENVRQQLVRGRLGRGFRFGLLFFLAVEAVDDLHHPEEMIRELMDDLKQIYGTKESYLLVNSSTAGNLAAIAALCNIGDKILVARNCHKSVYHAIELLGLDPIYIYPEIDEYGICKGITKEQIENIITKETSIKAMVLVSPTYEGRVSDIEGISDVLHRNNIPLIVDEAHGAHFIYHEAFPEK